MAGSKLTDPLLVVRGVAQRLAGVLADLLPEARCVRLRVQPVRFLFSSALLLHAALAQKGYCVETSPLLGSQEAYPVGRGDLVVETLLIEKPSHRALEVLLRSEKKSEKLTVPLTPAAPLLFFFASDNLVAVGDEMRVVAEATVLQTELVPQSGEIAEVLGSMGARSVNPKHLCFTQAGRMSVSESLASTIRPFLPGISLEDPSVIESELRGRGVNAGRPFSEMSEQEVRAVVSYVSEKVSSFTRAPLQQGKVLPGVYASEVIGGKEYDLRIVAGALEVLVETNPTAILSSLMSRSLSRLEATLNAMADDLRRFMLTVLQTRPYIVSGARVIVSETHMLPAPLSYARDHAALYGLIQQDDALFLRRERALLANCFLLHSHGVQRLGVRPYSRREEWCFFEVHSDEISKLL